MIYVNFKAQSGTPDTAEWHRWRQRGIGGSDAIIIAAAEGLVEPPSWVRHINALFFEKRGYDCFKVQTNEAMRRGTELEPIIRERFERRTGIPLMPSFGECEFNRRIRSSFDGVSFDDRVAEIKGSEKCFQRALLQEIPEYYMPQLAHQFLVYHGHPDTWRPDLVGYFCAGHPEKEDIATVTYTSGQLQYLARKLLAAEENFIDALRKNVAPAGGPRFMEFIEKIEPLIREKLAAEELVLGSKQTLVQAMSEGQRLDGFQLKAVTPKPKVDWRAIIEEVGATEDEIDRYRSKPVIAFNCSRAKPLDVPLKDAVGMYRDQAKRLAVAEAVLKPVQEEAKQLMSSLGLDELVGPYFSVVTRRGTPAYKRWWTERGIDRSIIARHTSDEVTESSTVEALEA